MQASATIESEIKSEEVNHVEFVTADEKLLV
jgi:hypothetical protein